jgi:hypothetical protein
MLVSGLNTASEAKKPTVLIRKIRYTLAGWFLIGLIAD